MKQPWVYMCSPSRSPLPPPSPPAPSRSSQCTRSESLSHDVFELWCWRRLLRVPWTARRSNQSILKESSLEYSLEGLMLKLKLQNFGHLMWRTDSFEKTLMLGKIKGRRRRGWQRMRWLDGITDLMDMGLGGFLGDEQGGQACCGSWGRKQLDMTERLNWLIMSTNYFLNCSLLAQMVKHLPASQETRAWSLGCEGPLEKEMATHSSILAWRIPWTEEPGGLPPRGRKESDMT